MPIQRIVCFKFKDDTTKAERDKHMTSLATLKDTVPQILTYSAGAGLSGDFGSEPQYDTLHYVTFDSMEAVNAYFEHPAHQQFVEEHKHLWTAVLVLNADIHKHSVE